MLYLEKFVFPDIDHDTTLGSIDKGDFYSDTYPFHLTSSMGLWSLDFEPITIICGSNGSGKSTILNVIAQKLCADRLSMFNTSSYFDDYVGIFLKRVITRKDTCMEQKSGKPNHSANISKRLLAKWKEDSVMEKPRLLSILQKTGNASL